MWYTRLKDNEKNYKAINRINQVLKQEYLKFKDIRKQNKLQSKIEDEKQMKSLHDFNSQKQDMFLWLKVPSRFQKLKKIIRERLVEIIGEV